MLHACGVSLFLAFLLWMHLLNDVISSTTQSTVCTICVNGQDAAYVNQTKALTAQGLMDNTCGVLLASVGLFQRDSPTCGSIQALGPFCGCPVDSHSCTLCANRSQLAHPLLSLPSIDSAAFLPGTPAGIVLDCGTLDSSLNYLYNETDTMCFQSRLDYGKVCGCPFLNDTDGIIINDNNTIIETRNSSSLSTTSASPPAVSSCKVCLNGSKSPLSNRTIHLGSLPIKTCSDLDAFASLIKADSAECASIQSLGMYCGCHIPNPACSFCPNGEHVPFPEQLTTILQDVKGLPLGIVSQSAAYISCGVYESILALPPPITTGVDPDLTCLVAQFRSGSCGCSPGYKAKLVTCLFYVSAALSLIGSFFVIRDIKNKTPERRTTYHHLILGLTFFDVITSIAYMLTGVLMPVNYGYQAKGNHATCILQGFLIQLGLTSLFYNLLLSIYYLLLIKYNWKERRFRFYRNYVHVPIIVIGVTLAGASTKFITPQLGCCYVASPPAAANFIAITVFFGLPVCSALLIMLGCTILMCYHVYSTENKSFRFSLRGDYFRLTKKVCWQSLFYCSVFVVTLPYLMVNYYGVKNTNFTLKSFWQLAVSALFAPAQGFLNSLIYFQKSQALQRTGQLLCCYTSCCRRCRCCIRRSNDDDDDDSITQTSPTNNENNKVSPPPPAAAAVLNQERPNNNAPTVTSPNSVTQWNDDEDNDEPFSAPAVHWLIN